jgi:hypothetical protein
MEGWYGSFISRSASSSLKLVWRSAAAAGGSPPCTRPSVRAWGHAKCGASVAGSRHCSGRQAGTLLAAPGCAAQPADHHQGMKCSHAWAQQQQMNTAVTTVAHSTTDHREVTFWQQHHFCLFQVKGSPYSLSMNQKPEARIDASLSAVVWTQIG